MIRKLHNSLIGLVTCSCLLLAGLLLATPLTPGAAPSIAPSLAERADLDPAEPALADTGAQTLDTSPPDRQVRRARQSVAMPFYSFAPRG
jgi:hypothetical protein